jgi:hypothetical protein
VDHFTLSVLFITERDDRGFTTTRVGTEFRVDVSLDGRGDRLGLEETKNKERENCQSNCKILSPPLAHPTNLRNQPEC